MNTTLQKNSYLPPVIPPSILSVSAMFAGDLHSPCPPCLTEFLGRPSFTAQRHVAINPISPAAGQFILDALNDNLVRKTPTSPIPFSLFDTNTGLALNKNHGERTA